MDDWEYSDENCPKCQSGMAERLCGGCGGEGYVDEEDEWRNQNERCETCNGKGHEQWCRECGWDMNFKCFLSPEYERKFLERQQA